MSLFDLTGKVAIVTGSSKGIGRAIAERLAEHGAKVVISSRKLEPCRELANLLNTRHGAGCAIACAANISSKEALQALPESVLNALDSSLLKVIGQLHIRDEKLADKPLSDL